MLALSVDGIRWGALRRLLPCEAHGERTVDQPAAGLVRRGSEVLFFIHTGVPGIRIDKLTPNPLEKHLEKEYRTASRLTRHAIPIATFRRWMVRGLGELAAAAPTADPEVAEPAVQPASSGGGGRRAARRFAPMPVRERLVELQRLRDGGMVTEAEFGTLRSKILAEVVGGRAS